jgi:hypothetical protein
MLSSARLKHQIQQKGERERRERERRESESGGGRDGWMDECREGWREEGGRVDHQPNLS